MTTTAWKIAVVGAGPVGLALALHAARLLPSAQISVFDARPLERDVAADPRTLALNLGSLQFLQRLGLAPIGLPVGAQAITEVHISQQPPSWGQAELRLSAAEIGVPQLGAVLSYGALLAPLQASWLALAGAEPQRLHTRFGTPVAALKPAGSGVEVDAGIAEHFDLAIVAEGGVFADQAHKALSHDYGQTAWVGTVTLAGATPGMAFERFTRHGPAALLPLPPDADGQARAALVWCVGSADDPVRGLDDTQRLAVLNTLFPPEAGQLLALTPLKAFPLGLNAERRLVDGQDGAHRQCRADPAPGGRPGPEPGPARRPQPGGGAALGRRPGRRAAPRGMGACARPLGHDRRHRLPGAQLHLAAAGRGHARAAWAWRRCRPCRRSRPGWRGA